MNEARVYADGYQRTFARANDLMHFLGERRQESTWIRKPTKNLRVLTLEKGEEKFESQATPDWEDILEDTKRNTKLVLQMSNQVFPIRDCAIKTLLDRAGISGAALKKLERKDYARIINLCLKVARGDALVKIADGKVSAVHGGDQSDYSVIEPETIFAVTIDYLNRNYPGNQYIENSGAYDHVAMTAMWELGRQQDLLETYREALDEHGLSQHVYAPALRLTTSDVGMSGVNIYPMLMCDNHNRSINLGTPLRLQHKAGASIGHYQDNLNMLYARYTDAVSNLTKLMDIEIYHPLNCLMGVLKRINISKKVATEIINGHEAKYGEVPCTAHDLYYSINEAPFIASCMGMQGNRILTIEENAARALSLNWEEYDVAGNLKW
ncbi:MAG: transposase [Brevinema sp.]